MAESDFMAAFDKRISEGGFDPRNMRGVGNEKRVADVAKMAKSVSGKQRPKLRQTGMGSFDPETGARASADQLKTVKEFEDYDAMREQLAGYITGNMYQGNKKPDMEQARKIVDDFARAQREQQYAAPATSTPESPVPTPASSTGFNGEDLRRALIEAPPVPSPMTAPRESDVAALRKELLGAPPVQPAETAPRESDALAAYEDIETGNAPKAIIVDESETQAPEISEDRMSALFRKTMGTAFDPKSKMDASKMNQLREFVGSNPDLLDKSDTKIALDYYRTLK
jgi:hypothetical protein